MTMFLEGNAVNSIVCECLCANQRSRVSRHKTREEDGDQRAPGKRSGERNVDRTFQIQLKED